MRWFKQILAILLVVVLSWNITSCSRPESGSVSLPNPLNGKLSGRSSLTEVSPPFAIQGLRAALEVYQPQVKILSPRSNQVLDDTAVEVKLQVSDLPLYQDAEFQLGPYVQVLLDNRPYAQLHDVSTPLKLEDLTPGTHTVRVFAVRPWHESFKNEGAFAQTTFHVFTQTSENNPAANRPLLTYNYPQGTYGAEPVLLDFHLLNAPLHLVAREDAEDAIPDWQIRCTVNGESFTFDRWEPIYLKGLKPGKNWVQLELLDEKGQPILNAFNNTVQVITYQPGGDDTLAKLTRGELTATAVRKIVDPNYVPPVEPEIEPIAEPEVQPEIKPDVQSETESKAELEEPEAFTQPTPETMPPEILAPETAVDELGEIEEREADSSRQVKPDPASEDSSLESATPPVAQPEAVQTPTQRMIPYSKAAEEFKPPVFNPEPASPQLTEPEPTNSEPIVEPPARNENLIRQAVESTADQSESRAELQPELKAKPEAVLKPEPRASNLRASDPPDQVEPSTVQERIRSIEKQLEELLKTPASETPAKSPESVLLKEKPALQSVTSTSDFTKNTSAASPNLLTPVFAPDAAPRLASPPASPLPDLMGQLDRIKDFFEGLRKPSEPQPLLAPLLEDQDVIFDLLSTESQPIEIPAQLEQPPG